MVLPSDSSSYGDRKSVNFYQQKNCMILPSDSSTIVKAQNSQYRLFEERAALSLV